MFFFKKIVLWDADTTKRRLIFFDTPMECANIDSRRTVELRRMKMTKRNRLKIFYLLKTFGSERTS